METGVVKIRMFGKLREIRSLAGAPLSLEYTVALEGVPAAEIADALDLPLDQIEGVFCNHVVCPLDKVIRPGDDIAFVPYGTPGPHRFTLGLYSAGKDEDTSDSE